MLDIFFIIAIFITSIISFLKFEKRFKLNNVIKNHKHKNSS